MSENRTDRRIVDIESLALRLVFERQFAPGESVEAAKEFFDRLDAIRNPNGPAGHKATCANPGDPAVCSCQSPRTISCP